MQKRGSALKKGAGTALDKCICLRGSLCLSLKDTVGVLHTQIKKITLRQNLFPHTPGIELWSTGRKTAIASGKGNTALESNREKWLGEEKKQAREELPRGAGSEVKKMKKAPQYGAFGILSCVL